MNPDDDLDSEFLSRYRADETRAWWQHRQRARHQLRPTAPPVFKEAKAVPVDDLDETYQSIRAEGGYTLRLHLDGVYNRSQLSQAFDLEPDELDGLGAWLCEENPGQAREVRPGTWEFTGLELEIREQGGRP